jgi:hypothetical protein
MKHLILFLGAILLCTANLTLAQESTDPSTTVIVVHPTPASPPVPAPIVINPVAPVILSQETAACHQTKPKYPVETLFSSDIYAHGGYGAVGTKITKIDGKIGHMVGGRGAWIVNHSFLLGGGGYGMSSENMKREFDGEMKNVEFGYGGLEFGYILNSNRVMHFAFQVLLGGGGVGYLDRIVIGLDEDGDEVVEYQGERAAFFVAEPMLYMEVNVNQWFRVCMGGGYRFVNGVDLQGVNNAALEGASAELLFKFGSF